MASPGRAILSGLRSCGRHGMVRDPRSASTGSPLAAGEYLPQCVDEPAVVFRQCRDHAHEAWTEHRIIERLDQDIAAPELCGDLSRVVRGEIGEGEIRPGWEGAYAQGANFCRERLGPGVQLRGAGIDLVLVL